MSLRFNKRKLFDFVNKCLEADLTYHRKRKELWEGFTKLMKEGKQENKDEAYLLDFTIFNSMKSALTCRSDAITDEKRLAFETAVQEIIQALLDDDVDEDDEQKEPAPKAEAPQ